MHGGNMDNNLVELRNYPQNEFQARINPLYSQRAFSRDLGVSTTSLGDFMSGKRNFSFANIDRVFKYIRTKSTVSCSWCGKPKREAKKLIGGPRRQFICSECVDVCNDILRTNRKMPA
jgi:ClpX C4-type zinc finger